MRDLRAGILFASLSGCIALLTPGCSGESETTGDAGSTLAFWNAVHKPWGDDEARQVLLRLTPLNPDAQSQKFIVGLMRELNEAKKANYERIAALPLVGVDEDAQAYGLQVVKVQQETVVFIEAVAQLLENPTGLPDFDAAALEYVVSVLRHLTSDGNPLWEAAKEQGAERANDVTTARAKGKELESQGQTLGARIAALTTSQLETRVKLTKRYSQEFPASVPAADPPASLPEGATASPRTIADLKLDLMGREIGPLGSPWPVEAVEEFETFKVIGSLALQRYALVDAATHVKGMHLGTEHDFKLRMVYKKGDKGWTLALAQQR